MTRQIAWLVYFHGALMTGWIIFFVVQASLIVRDNRSLHMKLGAGGVVLCALIVAVGPLRRCFRRTITPPTPIRRGGRNDFSPYR